MLERLPRSLLHVEGLAVLAGSFALYFDSGFGWLLLVVLFLAPDLSMLGYVGGPRSGALAKFLDELLGKQSEAAAA